MRPSRRVLRAMTLSLVIVCGDRPAGAEGTPEYAVKAAYLLNFARFVTYPPSAFADPAAPLTICILGADPFGPALDDMIAGERVDQRAIAARRLADPAAIDGCQILFVAATADAAVALGAAGGRPVLTVGDGETFAERGGMVAFRLDQGTVRFAVNPDALRRGGLAMSSHVLRLARIVPEAR